MGRSPRQQQRMTISGIASSSSSSTSTTGRNQYHKNRVVMLVAGIAFVILVRSFDFGGSQESSNDPTALVKSSSSGDVVGNSNSNIQQPHEVQISTKKPLKIKIVLPQSESPWPGKPKYELDMKDGDLNRVIRIGSSVPQKKGRGGGPSLVLVNEEARSFLNEHLNDFLQIYKRRPDPANACGGRLNHQFALYTIVKLLKPTTIIESGVYAGQSTYMFRQAAGPQTKIISIDPAAQPMCQNPPHYMQTPQYLERWIDKTNNEYLTGPDFVDFDKVNWHERIQKGDLDPSSTLIFMDDHQGFYRRFATFLKYGFRYVIHDDNMKLGYGMMEGDTSGDTPKQMWRNPKGAATQWLFHQALVSYAEFPPVSSPRLTHYTGWKKEPGFLYHTDDFRHLEQPLLQPEYKGNTQDQQYFEAILEALDIVPDMYRENRYDYFELFQYSSICLMELNPHAPQPPPPL